ncbi:MAG: SH3 domain-containing protein [Clostridia bacterium]|nr:SH3 domain-containing protein [Clostridia bacterium]
MVRSMKKIITMILAFMLLVSSSVYANAYDIDDIVNAAKSYIQSKEGYYDSINANDNGAVSIGRVQWHGARALQLLKMIVEANPQQAQSILTTSLYNEIVNSSLASWNYRCFNSEEVRIVKKLLATQESKDAQDQLSFNDIKGYVIRAQSMGITDAKALVYFADLENQLGGGGVTRVGRAAVAKAGSGDKVTLKILYDVAMEDSVASSSPGRRKSTYEYCLSLDFDNLEVETEFVPGKYKITASYLRMRKGPDVTYDPILSIAEGTQVTVTEVSDDWGKITYLGQTGWISLLYADYLDGTLPPKEDTSEETKDNLDHDINGNGKIDAGDARTVLRVAAYLEKLPDEKRVIADENEDGKITAADARGILRIAAKLK